MPQQVESAATTRLASISSALLSRKVRVAGWLLHYDADTSMLMMHDGEDALLVDISLCVRNAWRSPRWVFESKTVIMVVGYVESSVTALPLPVLSAHAPLVNVNPHLVLRAIVAEEARDLDMSVWNSAIEAQEETLQRSAKQQ
ncbi:hypothetical protein VTO73DRAFT_6154 [Trametes versicolor]